MMTQGKGVLWHGCSCKWKREGENPSTGDWQNPANRTRKRKKGTQSIIRHQKYPQATDRERAFMKPPKLQKHLSLLSHPYPLLSDSSLFSGLSQPRPNAVVPCLRSYLRQYVTTQRRPWWQWREVHSSHCSYLCWTRTKTSEGALRGVEGVVVVGWTRCRLQIYW